VRHLRRTVIGAALVAVGALQAGCGSSANTSSSNPASVTPVGARLFAGIALTPPGGTGSDADRDLRQLTRLANPFARLDEMLLAEGSQRPDFASQIEPWIGSRAGLFFTVPPAHIGGLSPTSPAGLLQGARAAAQLGTLVLDVRDVARARAFLAQRARLQGAAQVSYRGVPFELSPTGRAEGIVASFAVIGTRAGLEEAIDTTHGSPSLERAAGLKAPSDALATAFLAPPAHSGPLLAGVHSIWMYATAAKGSLSLKGELTAEAGFGQLLGAGGARELQTLPGGSWLALGTGDLGATLPRWLSLLQGISARGASGLLGSLGASGVASLLKAFSSLAAPLRAQLARWAGPAGLYVSGSDLFELQAALVVDSTDPAASRAAVGELASVAARAGATVAKASVAGTSAAETVKVKGFPAVLYIASGPHALVLGLGQDSVASALVTGATLAASHTYSAAVASLGGGIQPGAIVEFAPLLSLLEGIGVTQSPALSSIVPYLRPLGELTLGSGAPRKLDPGLNTIDFRATLTLSGSG
jgi:hypothetical protein